MDCNAWEEYQGNAYIDGYNLMLIKFILNMPLAALL